MSTHSIATYVCMPPQKSSRLVAFTKPSSLVIYEKPSRDLRRLFGN